MKLKAVLALGTLALAGYGWIVFCSGHSADNSSPGAGASKAIVSGNAGGNRGVQEQPGENAGLQLVAAPGQVAAGMAKPGGNPVAVVMQLALFEGMTTSGKQIGFALPDGKKAVAIVERREVDAAGKWVMAEGCLTAPAEGRFLFRRQPAGTPSGRYAGAMRFPSEDFGYILGESAGGEPLLTFHHADKVSCMRFAPEIPPEQEAANPELLLPGEHPTDVPIPAYQNGVIPLQSLPGAVGVIYLDFDGQAGPFNGWGDFVAAPSGASNTQILEVWSRVAEDYAPYNINVTTDLQVYLDAPETSRQRCIITPTTTAAPGAGGVAYIGSWNWAGDTPCWAFYSTGKAAAEVISHEVGHTLGLGHDGQTPDVGYYGGHGSGDTGWAPIMGVGYYQNLTQWSKGEYTGANETQDDLAVIDTFNSVDFRADDHGNTAATADPLELYGTTVNDDGIIGTRSDVDVFSFTTLGGTLTLNIAPVAQGPDLDLSAEIRNSSNVVIASANPDLGINATFTNLNLAAGTYTLHIDGVGRGSVTGDGYSDYASLGHYSIDGTINGAIHPDRFAINEFPPNGTVVGTVTPDNNHGTGALTYAILSGNTGGAFAIGASNGTLVVANPAQINHDLLSSGWNDPAEFELYVRVTDATQPALNETLRVIVTVNDTQATPPVILAHRYSFTGDATDAVGNADLTLVGGAAVTGGELNLPGGAARTNHATAQGAALTELAATIHGATAVTMEAWFNQDTAQNWAKIFMTGVATGADYMDITARRGADGNVSSMSVRNNSDTESKLFGGTVLTNNTQYYFAATWDGAANRMTLRTGPVGGTLSSYTASMGGRTLADIDVSQFFLGSAVYWGDPDFDGQLDEFRIWNGALGEAKVAANFAAGPNPAGDSDLDGLPDTWELAYAANLAILNGNLSAGSGQGAGSGDFDGDGLSDLEEYHGGSGGTNPVLADTDGDGFPDLLERQLATDPNNPNDKPLPRLAHRYSFNSNANDAIGHADLSLSGSSTVNGGSLDLPGGGTRANHALAQGAALTEIANTIHSAYALTIESWFNQDTAQNWAKLLMAGKGVDYNYMDITPRRLVDGNVSSLSIRTGATESYVIGGAGGVPLTNNVNYYCAATWNPLANQLILRIGPVGGALSTYTATMGGQKLSDLVVNEFRIGAAVQWGDPDFDGQIDELRIWQGARSASEIAASFAAGPGQPAGDLDADGLPDEWELSFTGITRLDNLTATGDYDSDGLGDTAEHTAGTDPTDADSDNDGFTDGFEISVGSNPNNAASKPTIPPTRLAHRYSFNTNSSDSAGHADLTLVGTAAVTGGRLDLPGGASRTNHATAQGAALTEIAGTIGGAVAISMEGWFNQNTAQNWSKLFMAGSGSGGEYLDITPRRGISGNVSSASFNDGSTESTAIAGTPLANNTDYYCAAVWNPVADQLTLHIGPVGGTISTFTTSMNGRVLSTVAINEFHLGAAVLFPDQDWDGQINEFRVWKGALTPAEVAASFSAGPNSPPGDSDGDGLPDAWEFSFANVDHLEDLNATGDSDGDGLTNLQEYQNSHSNPFLADTDGDGYSDRIEFIAGSNPDNPTSVPVATPAVLAHRYSFTNGVTDSAGGANLTLVGTAAVTGGKLNLPGGASRTNHATAQGASLTTLANTINGAACLTIEGWFNQDTAQNWAKLFMAGQSSGFKYLEMTPRRLVDGNVASISLNNGNTESTAIGTTVLANDVGYYFAATWNSIANNLTLRIGPVGGALQTYTATMGGKLLADVNIAQFFLGSAVQFGDPDFDGQLDEFRIWKGSLTNDEINLHFAIGPDVLNPVPVIGNVSMNAAKDTLTLGVSGLINGNIYHLESGTTLVDFAPLAGSQFTATGGTVNLQIAVNPAVVPKRFFRLVDGPLP